MNHLSWNVLAPRAPIMLFVASLCVCPTDAPAQLLNIQSIQWQGDAQAAIDCLSPREDHHLSTPSGSSFGDTVLVSFYGCTPNGAVNAATAFSGTLSSDKLYIHELASSSLEGDSAETSETSSNLVILFRVDAGQQLGYYLHVEEFLANPDPGSPPGTAWARVGFVLSHLPSGAVLDSLIAGAGPGLPTDVGRLLQHPRGVLDPGDYALELSASAASYPPIGLAHGDLYVRFNVWDATTSVTPTTWGRTKSLYR